MSMTPIQKAIAEAKYAIPRQILEATFLGRNYYGRAPFAYNIDSMIREKVVEPRVLTDCNLTGGTQVLVPLAGLPQEYVNPTVIVVTIPKDRTQNRRIVRTTSVMVGADMIPANYNYGMSNYSDVMGAASQVLASQTAIQISSTARVELIGENTIMISDQSTLPTSMAVLCYVENDVDLNNMRSMTISKFTRLVEYAIKAYVYNELIIPMAEGEMRGGMDLGRFKEIVDSYADANENYLTYFNEVWIKVQVLDDHMSRSRHLRLIMGGSK